MFFSFQIPRVRVLKHDPAPLDHKMDDSLFDDLLWPFQWPVKTVLISTRPGPRYLWRLTRPAHKLQALIFYLKARLPFL
jgi:hypothetical protein